MSNAEQLWITIGSCYCNYDYAKIEWKNINMVCGRYKNENPLVWITQYLLSTPINYTLTHFADQGVLDQINRYLAMPPSAVCWENVKPHLEQTPDGYRHRFGQKACEIALAKKQYSGNARGIKTV